MKPRAISAYHLSAEVGVSQVTLFRWMAAARSVPGLPTPANQWTGAQKLRVKLAAHGRRAPLAGVHRASLDPIAQSWHRAANPRRNRLDRRPLRRILPTMLVHQTKGRSLPSGEPGCLFHDSDLSDTGAFGNPGAVQLRREGDSSVEFRRGGATPNDKGHRSRAPFVVTSFVR